MTDRTADKRYTCLETVGPDLRGCGLIFGSWEELKEHEKTHAPLASNLDLTTLRGLADESLRVLDYHIPTVARRTLNEIERLRAKLEALEALEQLADMMMDYKAKYEALLQRHTEIHAPEMDARAIVVYQDGTHKHMQDVVAAMGCRHEPHWLVTIPLPITKAPRCEAHDRPLECAVCVGYVDGLPEKASVPRLCQKQVDCMLPLDHEGECENRFSEKTPLGTARSHEAGAGTVSRPMIGENAGSTPAPGSAAPREDQHGK